MSTPMMNQIAALATMRVAEHAPRAQRGPAGSESSSPEAQAEGLEPVWPDLDQEFPR